MKMSESSQESFPEGICWHLRLGLGVKQGISNEESSLEEKEESEDINNYFKTASSHELINELFNSQGSGSELFGSKYRKFPNTTKV